MKQLQLTIHEGFDFSLLPVDSNATTDSDYVTNFQSGFVANYFLKLHYLFSQIQVT